MASVPTEFIDQDQFPITLGCIVRYGGWEGEVIDFVETDLDQAPRIIVDFKDDEEPEEIFSEAEWMGDWRVPVMVIKYPRKKRPGDCPYCVVTGENSKHLYQEVDRYPNGVGVLMRCSKHDIYRITRAEYDDYREMLRDYAD